MAKKALTLTLHIDGARETLRAFNAMPKEASDDLRTRSMDLAEALAGKVRQAASAEGRQARLLAGTVKARRDRVPAIVAGGASKLGRNRKPAFKLLFGSEFGSNRLPQFKPHLGKGSYWFFKTVEANEQEISDAWNKVADDLVASFGGA